MTSNPILSIIMATWAPNKYRLNLLKETLKSFEDSVKTDYELIIVDNGPKEQTELLKEFDSDIIIKNEQNKGLGYCWNQGFDVSKGKYISLIDNDLLFVKGWADECIELLEKYPDKKLIATALASYHHHSPKYFEGELDGYYLWNRSGTAGSVFKRTTVDELGEWSVHPKPGVNWCNQLGARDWKFISLKIPKVIHRGIKRSYNEKKMLIDGKWIKEWGF